MRIEPVVRGLVNGLLADEQHPVPVDDTAAVLVRKIDNMPGLMRFGMRVLLCVFDWYGLVRGGRRFRASSLPKQRKRIQEWSRMPIGPCRDMVEFHRKMGVFVALSLEGGEHPG
tara:strand:+ start:375 stop:716 length:342 start_codon:yes stop_codon:yes gene_type:complete